MASGPLVDSVPDYRIKDGIVHVIVAGEVFCYFPLTTFRRMCAKSARVLAEYDSRQAEVVPLRRKRGEH